jgi:ribose transport system permease protein
MTVLADVRAPRLRLPVPFLLIVASVAAVVAVGIATGQTNQLSGEGALAILQRTVALGLVAVGQTFAILVASIDLSVANLVSVAAVLASFVMQGDPAMMVPGVLVVLGIGVLVGLLNGLLITKASVNPLIATLGTGLILQGLLSASFDNFAGAVPEEFQVLAYGQLGPLPLSILLMLALFVAGWIVLRWTRFGAHVYAAGGNPDGARLAGIRTDRVLIAAHVICSVCAAVAGLYLASRLRSGAPWVGRDGVYDLESIAVVVIGGTILAGGRGGVWGTLAGVILFGCLDTIFNMVGVEAFLKQVLRGLIVIAAVAAYAWRHRGHVA